MNWRKWALLAMPVILMLSLVACGGKPYTMADVPVPPQASVIQRGESDMADTMIDLLEQGMEGAATQQGMNIGSMDNRLYAVPNNVSWADIKSFYTDALDGTDWELDPQLTEESDVFNTQGWTRGPSSSEQGLFIIYTPDILESSGNLLVVMLVSE